MIPDRIYGGQVYRCVGETPYIRQSDRLATTLLEWQSNCADCGAVFSFSAPSLATKFAPNRRCKKHRQPGHKVKAVVPAKARGRK